MILNFKINFTINLVICTVTDKQSIFASSLLPVFTFTSLDAILNPLTAGAAYIRVFIF